MHMHRFRSGTDNSRSAWPGNMTHCGGKAYGAEVVMAGALTVEVGLVGVVGGVQLLDGGEHFTTGAMRLRI